MGTDKATLPFRGRPMIAIAIETLTSCCESVSIVGSRNDLAAFATVIPDCRPGEGPAGGIETGMLACASEWAMFLPVDLPLLSPGFVRKWAETALARPGTRASYVVDGPDPHPTLCLLRRGCASELIARTRREDGRLQSRLQSLLGSLEGLWIADARDLAGEEDPSPWFTNVNTPQDLMRAERQDEASNPQNHTG